MYQDNILEIIFSASISFSAVLIVVVTFMLMMYDAKRDFPEIAKPYRRASILISFFVFLPTILTSLISFGMILFRETNILSQYYSTLLRIVTVLFITSLFMAIFATLLMVKTVTKKLVRW